MFFDTPKTKCQSSLDCSTTFAKDVTNFRKMEGKEFYTINIYNFMVFIIFDAIHFPEVYNCRLQCNVGRPAVAVPYF